MNDAIKILGIIPARYASTRFPGKPLAILKDKPMIQWVYQALNGLFDYLLVATDDKRIKEVVESFGGNVILTASDHQSGTDRCNEVISILKENENFEADIVFNIQGDEPLIREQQIQELLDCFEDGSTEIATLVSHFNEKEDIHNPNLVKVVVNKSQKALYFSRHPIPFLRNQQAGGKEIFLKHIGIYAYKTSVLKAISKLSTSKLEIAESLEQLRWMENGYTITTRLTEYQNIGVDTPEDLEYLAGIL